MVLKTLMTLLRHGSGTAFPGTEKVKENSWILKNKSCVMDYNFSGKNTCTHVHTLTNIATPKRIYK